MLFTLADIEKQINNAQFAKGVEMFHEQRVKAPNVQRGGALITAVISSPVKPIRVYIRANKVSNQVSINGECNCAQRHNCAHVAAVLLQALEDNRSTNGDTQAIKQSKQHNKLPKPPSQTLPQALLYLLLPDEMSPQALSIQTIVARMLKRGTYGVSTVYDPHRAKHGATARFLTAVDIELLAQLRKLPTAFDTKQFKLSGPGSKQLLDAMVATGRCFYRDTHTPRLNLGEPRKVSFDWRVDTQGKQHINLHTTPVANVLLPLSTPCYLDDQNHEYGTLNSDLPDALINELIDLPAVAADQAEIVQQSLQQRYPDANLPPLRIFEIVKPQRAKPTPCLHLTTREIDILEGLMITEEFAYISFNYGGTIIKPGDPELVFNGKQLIQVKRDNAAEQKALKQLRELGYHVATQVYHDSDDACFSLGDSVEAALDFQLIDAPVLRNQGWHIEIGDDFRYKLAEVQHWYCDAKGSNDNAKDIEQQDWFTIGLGVEIDGQSLDLLPTLVQLLHEYPRGLPDDTGPVKHIIITLEDDRLLPLPIQRLRPLFNTLLELYERNTFVKDQHIRLNHYQLPQFTALDNDESGIAFEWITNAEIQQYTTRLRDVNRVEPVEAPHGLNATLRPYQQRGLDWLQFLRKYHLAGILADDMGLGKTIQALAHVLTEKQQGHLDKPCLVIAPTSLMFNWRQEATRFTPELSVLTLHGPERRQHFNGIADHNIILTTYPLLPRDQETLLKHEYHLLILDEAQIIKNPKSQATQIVKQISARHRICLTGTPMENHLGELWTLFDFLLPGLLGNSKQFRRFFRTPIEKNASEKDAERLSRRIRPFLLRRTKEQVAAELPPKTEIVQSVALENRQRELYETVRLAVHRRVQDEIQRQGISRSHIVVLDALLKLRQVCCDPRLVKMDSAKKVPQSAKLSMLMDMLPEMIEEGRRVLVFSQFTTMLGLIEQELKKHNIAYTKLTGQTRKREIPVQDFQQGKVPLFLISLKAGGVGLNLTNADTVIHYDPWWNPAVEQQATDRAHRIGQQNPVFVYKLICAGTLEEKIQAMQLRKQTLAENLYQQNGSNEPQWTEQDLELLFEPLGD